MAKQGLKNKGKKDGEKTARLLIIGLPAGW
jgi:hypothetical protein